MTTRTNHRRSPNGFTLTEAATGAAGLALLAALALPAFEAVRTDARLAGSVSNLATLGKANASYADLNEGRISGYDWDFDDGEHSGGPFPVYEFDLGGNAIINANDRLEIAMVQQAAILRRATGRFASPARILVNFNRLPQRFYNHLPMLDWFAGSVTEPIAVSPLDMNQQTFQSNPRNYELLPGGNPAFAVGSSWSSEQVVNRWPFASSYQSTTYAWSPSRPVRTDCRLAVAQAGDGSLVQINDANAITPQPMADVVFPSQKTHYYERFDYRAGLGVNGRFYAHPDAGVNVLAFDGSARLVETTDANPGWDPQDPENMAESSMYEFDQIDTRYFPDHGNEVYPGYHRWTRGGLEGIDVGAGEINTSNWCE